MIYMSDHGESLGEHGLYLHGAPDFIAPDEQTHVPFILWASGGDVRQDISYNDIKKKTDVRSSHQQLFHILLDFFEVETKLFNYDSSLRGKRYSSE
ncbi:Integral membrane protein [hydrothermal vent metagenome]|uniref:Integral membrane protein n=2 Tax=hydrothermal vent metagenome TaxID=652676 RepID=A0A1W1D6Y1_9ZZZZ